MNTILFFTIYIVWAVTIKKELHKSIFTMLEKVEIFQEWRRKKHVLLFDLNMLRLRGKQDIAPGALSKSSYFFIFTTISGLPHTFW